MRIFFLYIILLFPYFVLGQSYSEDCISATKRGLNTIQIDQENIKYTIVKYIKVSGQDYLEVDLLLPNYNGSTGKSAMMEILNKLPLKPGHHEVKVFKTCTSWNHFYQATVPDPAMEMQLQQGYIGYYEIDK